MRPISLLLACVLCVAGAPAIGTELAVIVHPNSGIDALTKDDVINIFMGRYRTLPSGVNAMPIDLAAAQGDKSLFYFSIVGKELSEIDSYWARLRFSGQGPPPRQASGVEEVIDIVSSSRGAIGYIDKRKVDKRVKVVLELPSRPKAM